MKDHEDWHWDPDKSFVENIASYIAGLFALFIVVTIGYSGYWYYEMRGMVKDNTQEMIEEYQWPLTVHGVSLPMSLIFARQVTAEVRFHYNNYNRGIIKVNILPHIDSIPVLLVYGGTDYQIEITGDEMQKLKDTVSKVVFDKNFR